MIAYYVFSVIFILLGLLIGFIAWADCELGNRRLQKFFQIVFWCGAFFFFSIGVLNLFSILTISPEKTQIVQEYYMEDKIPVAITVQGDKFQIWADHGIKFTDKDYAYITYRPKNNKLQDFFFDEFFFNGCFERLYIPQEKN